jgi:hypothetical protein
MRVNYKVVRNENGKLLSAVVDPPLCLEYKPGKWVRATIGGILVFTTKRAAIEAMKYLNFEADLELWSCDTRHLVKLPKYRLLGLPDISYVEALWARKFDSLHEWEYGIWHYLSYWPAGTRAYREVKLLRKVFSPKEHSRELETCSNT